MRPVCSHFAAGGGREQQQQVRTWIEECRQAIAAGEFDTALGLIRRIRAYDEDNKFAAHAGPIVERAAAHARSLRMPEGFHGLYRPEKGDKRPLPSAEDELPL